MAEDRAGDRIEPIALHQEMQGYVRVSPAASSPALAWGVGK